MQHEVPYVVGCGWLALAGATVDQSTTNYNGNSIRAVDGSTNGAFADGSCTQCYNTGAQDATSLAALNATTPGSVYATRYPELLTIYEDHPCVPVHNDISGNRYCHTHSAGGGEFLDRTQTTITSWLSTASNNSEDASLC